MDGAQRIAAERKRQVEVEGWDAAHDDRPFRKGRLAVAAACYALHAGHVLDPARVGWEHKPPSFWPFAGRWWKPKDPVRDLERAGALIAAEIDRILRERKAAG